MQMRTLLSIAVFAILQMAINSYAQDPAPATTDNEAPWSAFKVDSLGDPLPKYADYRFGTQRFQHPGSVIDMVLAPDEKTIVTYGQNRLISWDTENGKYLWKAVIEEHSLTAYGIRSLAFAADSRFFYSAGKPNTLLKWTSVLGASEKITYQHDLPYLPNNRPVVALPGATRAIDVTQDGTKIAAAGAHGVVVCDAKGQRIFEIPNTPIAAANVWPGKHVLFNQDDESIEPPLNRPEQDELEQLQAKERELASKVVEGHPALVKIRERIAMLKEHREAIHEHPFEEPRVVQPDRLWGGGHYSLAIFSPDSKQLAVVTSEAPRRIRLYDVSTGAITLEIESQANIVRLCFSPDGQSIATTQRDNAIRQYSTQDGKLVWANVVGLKVRSKSYTTAIAYRPDSKQVMAGASIDGQNWIAVLESKTGEVTATLKGLAGEPWALVPTKDSKMLYSSGSDGTIRRWSLETYRQLGPPQGLRGSSVITSQSHGDQIAFADDLGTVHVINTSDGKQSQSFAPQPFRPTQLVFSLDSQLLAFGGASDSEIVIMVWNLLDGKTIQRLSMPTGEGLWTALQSVAISPDRQRLAATTHRPFAAKLWDLASGKLVAEMPHAEISGISFSRDSQSLVTVGWDNKLNFWNAQDGQLRSTHNLSKSVIGGAETRLRHAIFSPTQDSLATSHLDGTVRIWSSKDMTLKRQFTIPRSFASSSIAYSPDGKWLATGSGLGEVTLWDHLSGKAAWTVGKHESPVATVGFAQHGQRLVSASQDGLGYCWNLNPSKGDANSAFFDSVWNHLAPTTSEGELYLGLWSLIQQGEQSITSIKERLTPLRTLVDWHQVGKETNLTEGQRRQSLLQQLVKKDAKIEFKSRVRLALYALVKIDTRESIELLQQLEHHHACSTVRELASEALAIRTKAH
jgi:WD40 repeat protein